MSAQRAGARRVAVRAATRARDERNAIDGSLAENCSCAHAPCDHDRAGIERAAANRRSLSNLETITGFAAMLRGAHPRMTARGSVACASYCVALEGLGAAERGLVGRTVASALDRQRRGAR